MCLLVQCVAQKGWEARGPQVSVSPHRLWLERDLPSQDTCRHIIDTIED